MTDSLKLLNPASGLCFLYQLKTTEGLITDTRTACDDVVGRWQVVTNIHPQTGFPAQQWTATLKGPRTASLPPQDLTSDGRLVVTIELTTPLVMSLISLGDALSKRLEKPQQSTEASPTTESRFARRQGPALGVPRFS